MEALEELKKWVDSLSQGEKRNITALGKSRSGPKGSQQLQLFEWLNQADLKAGIPDDLPFLQNLPTVILRLKDLILDALRLLHKDANVDAELRTALDEVAVLHKKALYPAATRLIKRSKKLAFETSRYAFALQLVEWERKFLQGLATGDTLERLKQLRTEELDTAAKWTDLQDLRNRHELLQVRAKQIFVPREPELLREVQTLAQGETVERLSLTGNYVEQALAVNILGIKDLFERNPMAALIRYHSLLQDWNAHPQWQVDQAPLLLLICNCYQSACFYSHLEWKDIRNYLALIPNFQTISLDAGSDSQRMIYHNQLLPALNTGNFESVKALIPQIDNWLRTQGAALSESQTLPFLHNFAVAEFLAGNFTSANHYVIRILNTPSRKIRQDIIEFARVLQAVLQYEMGNVQLNEYLTRSGKRHFSKHSREMAFEIAIFHHLEIAIHNEDPTKIKTSLQNLIAALDDLAQQMPNTVPLLGLTEMRLWAKSKQTTLPIKTHFLEAIQENLASLA